MALSFPITCSTLSWSSMAVSKATSYSPKRYSQWWSSMTSEKRVGQSHVNRINEYDGQASLKTIRSWATFRGFPIISKVPLE
jgi:hypothetical protein